MVEPFNGPMLPSTLGGSFYSSLNSTFRSAIGDPVTVTAGATATASIAVPAGAITLNPTSPTYGGGIPISPGGTTSFQVLGQGIDNVADAQFEIIGTGIRITRIVRGTSTTPAAAITITADADATTGLRTIILRTGDEVAFVPGAIKVRPPEVTYMPALLTGLTSKVGEFLRTGLAFITDTIRVSTLTYTAYGSNGALIAGNNPSSVTLNASAQRAALDTEIFNLNSPAAVEGWMQLRSTEPGAGLFLVFDSEFSRITDGTGLVRMPSQDLILPFGSNAERTFFSIANPNGAAATLTLDSVLDDGTVATSAARSIPVHGSITENWQASGTGYLRVRSDTPVVATELFGSNDLSALTGTPGQRATSAVFPHFAVGGGYTTEIGIVNGDTVPVTLDLRAYGDDGVPISTVSRLLQPRQRLFSSVATLFSINDAQFKAGYIRPTTTTAALLAGYTRFVYAPTKAATAVLFDASPKNRLLFPHVAHGVPAGGNSSYLTGIAIVNSDASNSAWVTVTAFGADSAVVASTKFTLSAGQKRSFLLNELGGAFATLQRGNGSVIVSSDRQLYGYELFFTDTLSIMAAVPAP